MSSDQQSNAHLNISIDQPVLWDHSNSTQCYTHINEAATTDAVKGNEIFNDCHIEHSQYSRIESLDGTEILKNVLSSEVNEATENNSSLTIQSSENIERSRHEEDTEVKLDKPENEDRFSEIVESTEGLELPFIADAVLITSRVTQEDFGILNDENDIRSDDVPCDSNELSSVTTDIEENLSNIVDLHNGIAIEPHERTNSDQINSILDTNDEPIQPRIPQISEDHYTQDDRFSEDKCHEKPTSKERQDDKCDKISEIHEAECAGQDDGHEIDETADLSTDEAELISNEPDFDDDNGEYRSVDVVDFDGTDEVENDEYILDTVVHKPRKERRRILMLTNDDDSDAEMEVEREQLLKSPMMDENVIDDAVEEEDVDIELLIQNEKPGPKSKKMSTQKLKELQTRALLRNAVVIPSKSKKKKCRIIDSDDEDGDNSLLPYCVDVDDIGLPDVSMENEESDAVEANSILMNDVYKNNEVAKQEDDVCGISSYENQLYSTEKKFKTESPTIITSQQSQNVDVSSESSDHLKVETTNFQETTTVKQEPENTVMKIEGDSEDSTDSTNRECLKKKEFTGTNFTKFPSFSSSSSSDDDDEFIPNDVYFGTPDVTSKRSGRGKGRPRGSAGRPAQSSSRGIAILQNDIQKSERGRGTGRRPRNRFIDNRRTSPASDSVSTSSSIETDDEYQKSKAKRKSHTITIVKSPSQLYHNVSPPIRPIQQQQQQQQIQRQRRKRDRFYDKSQDIPNAIYFGEVDVPLHVLHAYGGDSDSDNDRNKINSKPKQANTKFDPLKANTIRFLSQVSRGQGRIISKHSSLGQQNYETLMNNRHLAPSYSNNCKVRGRPKVNSVSPSSDRSIQMMKKFFKAAGLKKVKLNKLWEGCKSNSERATKMLELLREKGLEGEPTISKCKQLKLEHLTKKEIEDLDPNLIIQTEGRTRRSVTRAATKRIYTYDEEEILETRTKLRNVIDSDSDFE